MLIPKTQEDDQLAKAGYLVTDSFKVGGDRAAIPDVSIDPFAVSALAAASALSDVHGDVDMIEFARIQGRGRRLASHQACFV